MIQRIQSVYLSLVFIFAILFLLLPTVQFKEGNDLIIRVYNFPFLELGNNLVVILGYVLIILCLVIAVLSVYTIFSFRKRRLQIKLGKINILLHVALVVSFFFITDELKKNVDGEFSYAYGVVFPLISMILILIANRAIRKDEQLVRASERLRP
jgi:uncharacterized membrane protein